MKPIKLKSLIIVSAMLCLTVQSCSGTPKQIERPEKIFSKRLVVYDQATYIKLADLWHQYYKAFPSEDAYANWMYAARYAEDPDYDKLLQKGVDKYPANPTLLYLYGIKKYDCHDDSEGQRLLEKAARLDPTYQDPWFALVGHYMDSDEDKLNSALRHLLENGAIPDEIMDYNYNVLASMETNGILITNGDMDTYPGWILSRIVKFRPDVRIVNRSLLNTDWYPPLVMKEGVPKFTTQSELAALHESILKEVKSGRTYAPASGPFGDTLIVKIIKAATREKRPVYFAATLYTSDVIERYTKTGRNLGLVTLVTPAETSERQQIRNLVNAWLNVYRTAGMDSWQLRYAGEGSSGLQIIQNYAYGLYQLMDEIIEYAPASRLDLFHWYQTHLRELISEKNVEEIDKVWCRSADIKEIGDWCRKQGYLE